MNDDDQSAPTHPTGEANTDEPMDTVMAAGERSGAAGVANADLGTSGAPAQTILTPEELAQTEIDGGAGLTSSSIDNHQLDGYFGNEPTGSSG